MSIKKILVAYDGSELSKKALDKAVDIAQPNTDILVDIVNVVAIPLLTDTQTMNLKNIIDMMMEDGRNVLQKAYDQVEVLGDQVNTLLLPGTSPATEILKMSEKENYDLIIIGSRGLGGIKEYLGSVSHKVLQGADIPVLIAK